MAQGEHAICLAALPVAPVLVASQAPCMHSTHLSPKKLAPGCGAPG